MNIVKLCDRYLVRPIEQADIPGVYALCKGNPLYFQHCPPFVTPDSIERDLAALPPGMGPESKHYVGFYTQAQELVAVMDLILGYPEPQTAFIGFFMLAQQVQGQGVGSHIVTEVCRCLKEEGFSHIRLGYAKGNPQSQAFWIKNGFAKTGVEKELPDYTAVFMQREL